MKKGTPIAIRGVRVPSRLRREVERRIAALEHFYPDLVGCRAVIEGPGRRHRTGGPYVVRIELRVPGGDPIVVDRQDETQLELAIGEAFDVASRRLEDFARIQRGDVKIHGFAET
jgi:ribosome-associated translation inhibitor RaiA